MSVSIADPGESPGVPDWLTKYFEPVSYIKADTLAWIKNSDYLFFAWHYYFPPPIGGID